MLFLKVWRRGLSRLSVSQRRAEASLELGWWERKSRTVMARQGGTVVVASCTVDWKNPNTSNNFAPLSVDYSELSESVGRIPKTFNRREFRGKDLELLVARMIDRSIRPLLTDYKHETQIVCRVHGYDGENDPEILALNACSAAVHASGVAWRGPFGAVRMSLVSHGDEGELVDGLPLEEQRMKETKMNLVVSALGQDKIVMAEMSGREVREEVVVQALQHATSAAQTLVDKQLELISSPKSFHKYRDPKKTGLMLQGRALALEACYPLAVEMIQKPHVTKQERGRAQTQFWLDAKTALESLADERAIPLNARVRNDLIHDALQHALRNLALHPLKPYRPDGRGIDEIRPIYARSGVLPVPHGSAIFSRGNTQVLCSTALGPLKMARNLRPSLEEMRSKQFLINYSFPPYAVNRTGLVFGNNRRMVGHGALAEKAILPLLEPDLGGDDPQYPFAINVNSEVTASDGSSSMATVCGATLALLDACAPLKRPVAGISIGLYTDTQDESQFVLPVDILGMEDHFGDMDCKVAGTSVGITAWQLDIKRPYVTLAMLEQALLKAKEARRKVLAEMTGQVPHLFGDAFEKHKTNKISALPVSEKVILDNPQVQRSILLTDSRSMQGEIEQRTGAIMQVEISDDFVRLFAKDAAALQKAKALLCHTVLKMK